MKNRLLIIFFLGGLVLNVTGYYIAMLLELPVFLDCAGSVLAGVVLGPVFGALTGFTSNLIFGVMHNPVNIPFSVVNAIIGFTAGIITLKMGFNTFKSLLTCIFILTVISSATGALISFYLFGGITGANIDLEIVKLMDSGYRLYFSAFTVRLISNFFDKGISCLFVYYFLKIMKPELRFSADWNSDEK